jgi:hypothetical protein
MSKSELSELSDMLKKAARSLDDALKYESASAKHPTALRHEEEASDRIDAAIMYFAAIRSRAIPGPTMRADGSIYDAMDGA